MLNVVATFLYSPLNLCHLEGTSFALLSLQPIFRSISKMALSMAFSLA